MTWKEYLESKQIDINSEMQDFGKEQVQEQVQEQEQEQEQDQDKNVSRETLDYLKQSVEELKEINRLVALNGNDHETKSIEEQISDLMEGIY